MRVLVLAAAVLFSLAAPAAHAEDKLGVVDLQRALNEVEEGATAKKALKAEFDTKQKTLDAKQNELKKLKDELDAQSTMMTPEKKAERIADLQKKLLEVQQLYMSLQQDLSKREGEATAAIFQKMGVILGQMGAEQGFSAIVEKTAVPFFKPSLDVTNELIRRYNDIHSKKKKP
ncbi:MAG: OmpH family outer membrane protein [Deltaproteobacteria bacterium]|nr:OmpH family outer membrane protein [Deltaproteobacteria bacterium]